MNLRSYSIATFIILLIIKITESQTTSEGEYDLCIIGSGFFGSAAAKYASANPGLKICLIGLDEPRTKEEYDERQIFSSHYDSARIMVVIIYYAAFQKMCRKTVSGYKELEKLSGMNLYNPVGSFFAGKRNARLMKSLEDITAAAGTPYEVMSRKTIEERYPFLKLKNGECGIIDGAGSGIIRCREVVQAQMQVAAKQGCHLIRDEVLNVEELRNNYHIIKTAKHGNIKAKRVLFTTGCFAYYSNFTVLPRLYIQVYRQLATLVKVSEEEAKRLISMPALLYKRDDNDVGSYILPPVKFPDGKYYLKIGSLDYETGEGIQSLQEVIDWYHSKGKPGELEQLSERLFELIPDLKSEGLFPKVCVTCATPTGFPYIQRLTPTVTVAVVGNGGGASLGDEVGRLAAHLSLTGEWDSDTPQSLFEAVFK